MGSIGRSFAGDQQLEPGGRRRRRRSRRGGRADLGRRLRQDRGPDPRPNRHGSADPVRARVETAAPKAREAEAQTAIAAAAGARLEHTPAREAPSAAESGPSAFARRADAFAALIRGRTAELALVVGHGPGAHASGQMLRQALKAAGVPVRWCRLKPSAEADHAPADTLTVYADPARPEASTLVEALTRAGFAVDVAPFRPADPGLPSPAIMFAAGRKPPTAAALSLCNPVLGAPVASRDQR